MVWQVYTVSYKYTYMYEQIELFIIQLNSNKALNDMFTW